MKVAIFIIAGLFVSWNADVSAEGLNDGQIAAAVLTANQVDIDAGALARIG